MIRASRLHREGRGFESLNIHHKNKIAPGRFYFCVWGCGTKTPVGVFDNESASILIKCECSTRSVRERMPRSRRLCAVRGSPGHPPQNKIAPGRFYFVCHTKPCAKCGFFIAALRQVFPHEALCEVWLSFFNTHMSAEQKTKHPTVWVFYCWRPGSESNRHTRICSPLHNHSATRPN